MAEPLAVCLHAARQAGSLLGCQGAGHRLRPDRHAGGRGRTARRCRRDRRHRRHQLSRYPSPGGWERRATINVAEDADALAPYTADKGTFDVLFEASGNEAALRGALDAVRCGGIVVQLGLGGDMKLPINVIVTKELQLRGTFRFDEEFRLAVDLMGEGAVDVKPLLTETLPFERATEAFELASDRSRAMKVQLAF